MCSHRGVGHLGGTDRVALVLYTRTRDSGGNDSHRGGGLKGGTDRVDTHCSKFAKRGGTGAGTHKPVHPYAVLVPPPRFTAVPTTQVDDEMGCAKNDQQRDSGGGGKK